MIHFLITFFFLILSLFPFSLFIFIGNPTPILVIGWTFVWGLWVVVTIIYSEVILGIFLILFFIFFIFLSIFFLSFFLYLFIFVIKTHISIKIKMVMAENLLVKAVSKFPMVMKKKIPELSLLFAFPFPFPLFLSSSSLPFSPKQFTNIIIF